MTLYFQQQGEGKPILILHGLFGSSDNWRNIATSLSDIGCIYTVDLPNHGQSPHTSQIDYDSMAKAIAQWMQDQQIHSANIIGHSIGGKIAMTIARDYPELVDRMIIVDMAPRQYDNHHQAIFDALLALDLATLQNRREADHHLSSTITEKAIRQFLLMNLVMKKDALHWRVNLSGLNTHYENLMRKITIQQPENKPVLFMRGGLSDYINEGDLKLIKQNYPNSTVELIPAVGHWIHAENPKAFLSIARSFLSHD